MLPDCFTPFPVLMTDHLMLGRLNEHDAPEIFLLRSDPVVNKYLDRRKARSIDDALEFIRKINSAIDAGGSLYWTISLGDRRELAGTICLWNFAEQEGKAEIGYELLPQFHGKGIMQEAIAAVIQYGFEKLKLKKIEAWTADQNIHSIGILQRNHFKRDLEAESKLESDKESEGVVIYSLYR